MKTQKSPKLGRLLHLDEHVFVTASILFCAPLVLLAGNDTWTGAGADANWNTAGNWTGANTPPVAGDSLFFDGVLNTAAVNNIAANTAFSAVTFNATAGAFTLSGNVINLNGGITNNAGFAQTISLPMALQATESINTGSGLSGQLTLSGIISGASFGLTESGGGLLALSGVNTFTGPVTVNGGTLSVAADTGLGAVPVSATPGSVVLNGGSLRTSAGITLSANRGIALGAAAGGSGTIDTGNATTSVASIYNGILANNGGVDGFIKTGLGTLTLGGANTFTGGVIINQGTLKLDFTQSGAPTANIINPANSLVMGGLSTSLGNATAPMNTAVAPGATLNVTGNSTAARSQTFNGLTLSNGLAYVTTAQTSGKTVLLALGGITNFVGAVDFTLGGTFSSGVNAITTTTPNDLSGILGGEAVYGTTAGQPSAYATVDGSGNIIAYTGYSNITANAAGIISNPTNNVRINAAAVATTSLAGSPTTANINTLTLNANVNSTVNLAAGDTLRLGTNGGLMVTYGNWGLTIGQTMGQGTLTAGGGAANTAGILNFLLDSQNGGLTINSVVADNGTGAVGLNIANTQKGNNPSGGAYGVVLNAANTFSGGTIIAAGQGNAENPSAFGTGPVTVLNGGQAYLGTNGNYPNAFNIAGSGTSYNGGAAALHLNSGGAVVSGNITLLNDATIGVGTTAGGIISGPISGNYNLPLGDGAGWFSLTGANTYSGNTTVGNGFAEFGNRNALYSGNPANWTAGKIRVVSGATLALAVGSSPYFTPSDLSSILTMASSATAGFETGSSIGFDTTYAGGTYTYSGNITNAYVGSTLGITKLGAGTLVLSGVNGYNGTNLVNGGTLNYTGQLGLAPATPAGPLIVNSIGSNAIFSVDAPANIRFNNNNSLIGDSAVAGGNAGAFYQTGGQITGINQFQLGAVTGGSYGYYNLSGGTNTMAEFDLGSFSGAAIGVSDISGGVFNVTNWFVPSRGTSAIGILNMTGGAFNYFGPAGQFLGNWNSGPGSVTVLNIANASLIASNANVNLMQTGTAGKLGEINLLSGGLLQANSIAPGSATGTSMVNFNGGTLRANNATTTFLTTSNSSVNVYSGGGTINNNGVNITNPVALQAPAGGGINGSVTLNNGGSGYIGAPAVTFSGGGGTGAAGYATISGGAVTGIVITSPGINYSTTPTIVLTGGGGSGASATAPAPTANTSGGMTFTGTGTTTLSAANTYTGTTTVSAGKLALSGSGSISSSATIAIAAGATLDVSALTGNFALGGSQGLTASGTASAAVINGGAAQTINLGSRPITLNYDGANPALTVSQGTLSLNGNAFTVNGTPLASGPSTSYTLIRQASGSIASAGTYTASGTAIGARVATVTVSGGTVTLNVDSAPVIAASVTNTVTSGLLWKISILSLSNAAAWSDPDGDHLSLASVTPSVLGTNVTTDGHYVYYQGAVTANDRFNYVISDGTLTATGTVYLVTAPTMAPAISSPAFNGSGHPTFGGNGIPGYVYGVESATSLGGPWTEAGSVTVSGNGSWNFTDTAQVNPPLIFYRLYYPDNPSNPPQ